MLKSAKKIAVIGDIHGCINPLKDLYEKVLKYTDEVYSVGDLIDRGKNSKEVIQFCIDNKISPVRGNHEDMLLKAIQSFDSDNKREFNMRLDNCLFNGGKATYKSYIGKNTDFAKFCEVFRICGHYDLISSLPVKLENEFCYITHAGIIKDATETDLLWNRTEPPAKLNKFQIFGHTPIMKVEYVPGYFANIDTGCFYTGKLSAAIISADDVKFITNRKNISLGL